MFDRVVFWRYENKRRDQPYSIVFSCTCFGRLLTLSSRYFCVNCQGCVAAIIIIFGVVPLRVFPVGRRGIGCRVRILGGRRLAGLVRLVGRACPSRGCRACMAFQLVGQAPTPHGALGGRQAFAGCVVPPRPHSRQNVVRRRGGLLSTRPPGDAM